MVRREQVGKRTAVAGEGSVARVEANRIDLGVTETSWRRMAGTNAIISRGLWWIEWVGLGAEGLVCEG
jgi:hypothetical protein